MARVNGGNINFNVNMTVQKNGLNEITQPLKQIQNQLNSLSTDKIDKEFQEAAASAKQLESIINSSWNDKLGQLNLDKFNQSVNTSYGSVAKLRQSLSGAGTSGQQAFNNLAHSVLNTNLQLKQSNKLLDSMATSMANTVKWGITSSVFNTITSSIKSAYYYAKDLDTSLNNIRIVTGQSADEMQRFAKVANNAAGDLGRSTLDYTKAALSFYQQGLSDEEVQTRTNVTLKAQNITGVGSEMVDYLTSVWNGFKATAEDAEGYVDKLAKVADSSASDMSELAIAMSKVAATANLVGVDVDQLTAQLATVIATTRQAPESVGTAFKTIYSRINDIKTGADDAQISLGNYSGKMAELGFNVLDANGQLRDTGQILEQIGSRWDTLSKAQQIYLAQTMGGQRQITQISALFENWTTYSDLLNDSLTAQGTLNQKNDIYLESTAAHMRQLSAETERTYDIMFNQDTVNGFADIFKTALKTFNDYLEGIGGGANVFVNFGSAVANVFNKQIGNAINVQIQNIERLKNNLAQVKAQQQWSQAAMDQSVVGHAIAGDKGISTNVLEKQAAITQKILQVRKGLTQQQYNELQATQRQIAIAQTRVDYLNQYKKIGIDILNDQNASIFQFEDRLKIEKEELQIQKQSAQAVFEAVKNYDTYSGALSQNVALQNVIFDLQKNSSLTKEQKGQLQQYLNKLANGEKLENEEIKKIIEIQNSVLEKQQILVNRINQGLQGRKAAQDGTTKSYQNTVAAGERIVNQQTIIASRQIAIQNAVRMTSGLVQAASSAIGGITTALNESSTASEKLNGIWAAGTGSLAGIFNMIMPGTGFLVQGISGLVKSSFELIGVWQSWEYQLKSSAEKIADLKENISNVNSQVSSDNKTISSLQDLEDEWNNLYGKVHKYGLQSDKLTDDEKDRYQELITKFSEYNESVISGYDLQGNAIVNNQEALKETIQLLKQQKRVAAQTAFGDINQNLATANLEFTDPYTELEKAKEKRGTLQSEIYSKNFGGDINTFRSEFSRIFGGIIMNNSDQIEDVPIENFFKGINAEDLSFLGDDISTINDLLEQINSVINNNDQILNDPAKIETIQNILNNLSIEFEDPDLKETVKQITDDILGPFVDINEIISQADEQINTLQKQVDKLNNKEVHFDDTFLLQALQYGQGYKDSFKRLESLDFYNDDIYQTVIDYISGYTFNKELEEADIENKQAASYQQVLAVGKNFVKNLYNILIDYQDLINNTISQVEDISNFDSIDEYKNYIQNIIQGFLNQLDMSQFQTQESQQSLKTLLENLFNIDNLKFDFNVEGITVDTSQAVTDIQTQYQNAINEINETLNKFNYSGQQETITIDFLSNLINEDQIKDFDEILNQINWGAFLKYVNEGKTAANALTLAYKETKEARENLAENNLDFDTVFNSDELVQHLENKKKLTDEELAYLNVLQAQDEELTKLAETEGRASADYIKKLQEKSVLGQEFYKTQIKSAIELAKTEIENADIILKYAKEGSDEYIDASNIKFAKTQEIITLNYELDRTEQALIDKAQERAKKEQELVDKKEAQLDAEREVELERSKSRSSMYDNAKSVLTKFENGDYNIEQNEAIVLAYLQQQDPILKSLAENQENRGRLSKEYIEQLKTQLGLLKDISEEEKQHQIEIYKQELAEKQKDLEKLNNQIIPKSEYITAKTALSSSTVLPSPSLISIGEKPKLANQEELENQKAITEAYENQSEERRKQKELESEIEELLGMILILTNDIENEDENSNKTISQRVESFRELANTLTSGGELSAQQMSNFENILQTVITEYPELQGAAETLKETWLAGTEAYSVALREVGQALDQLMYKDLNQTLSNAFDDLEDGLEDLHVGIDPTDFEDWANEVEEFLNADKTITIAVHTDAENEFNRITTELENIYTAAGKIGENFVVAANDIRELNNVFPGIIQGMQMLDDGSYQLNSNIVQRAIATAQATSGADAQAVNKQLQNQSQLLHSKAATYKSMADAAGVLAGTQTEADMTAAQARITISKDLADLKATNAKLSSQNEMDNEKVVADSSKDNSEIVASNWAGASQSAAQSIYEFANSAIANYNAVAQAAQAAMNGQVVIPSTSLPSIASGYTGSGGSSKQASVLSGTQSALQGGKNTSKSTWAELQRQYQRMYQVTERAANDIDGMIAQIGAQVNDVGRGIQNVSRGQGIKGSKEGKQKNSKSSSSKNPSSKTQKEKQEKEKDPEFIELLQDEKDRYHDIDLIIKAIDKDLSRVQKTQKKLYGKDLINNLNQQVNLLEKQIDAYKTKIELATQERDEIQNSLKAQGVLFDRNSGAISNYVSAMQNKLNQVNSIIAYYDTLSAAQQQNYKDVVQAAKKDYQNFKKQIERYDELVSDTLPELREKIEQARDKQVEIAISKFKMAIEIELDLSKAKREWNDFKKKVIDQIRDDDILRNTKSTLENFFSYYDKNNKSSGLIPSLTDQVLGLMDQLDQINYSGSGDIYGNDKKQALEDLQNYAKELMSSLEDVEDIIKEVEEAFYDMVDASQDAFDEQIKEYNFLSDLIDHDKKLIQLLYGEEALDKIDTYNKKQIETDKRELDFQKRQKDFWYAKMQAQKNRMQNLDKESNAYKEAEKRFKELEQHWLDAVKDFNSQVEKSIQHLLDQYQNNVGIIFQNLNKTLTNEKGLEYIEEEWELINDNANQYLDTINSMYEIQKLQQSFEDAIEDSNDNLKAQKSLTNLMNEQLKMLKDKDRLTKYDVDRANLLLQIEVKRLALEQSRSNKSKLRLRRDSQGNYSYQYVADEKQMAQAEQDLADARNSLYNLDKDQYAKNQNDILTVQKDFNDKLKKLYEQYPIWTEQAEAKRQLLIEQYGIRVNGLVEQNENIRLNLTRSAFDELANLYDTDVNNFINMSKLERDELISNLIPQWNSGVQEMTNKIAGQGGFIPSCERAFEELKNNTKNYQLSLKDLQSQAGISLENVGNGIDIDIVRTNELIDDNRELIDTYNEEWDALQKIIEQVEELTEKYKTAKLEAIAAMTAVSNYIELERKRAAAEAAAQQKSSSSNSNSSNSSTRNSSGNTSSGTNSSKNVSNNKNKTSNVNSSIKANAIKEEEFYQESSNSNNKSSKNASWSRIVEVYNLINSGKVGNDPYRKGNLANRGYNSTEIARGQQLINRVYPASLGGYGQSWDAARRAMGYKTGGYTGEWGHEGKIGILHEKELVLNAEDTKNILSAVQATRDMSQLLKLININGILSKTLNGLTNQNTSDIDQKVYINASFPAVNSRIEIEEAFNNLINRASQYSFNTRR